MFDSPRATLEGCPEIERIVESTEIFELVVAKKTSEFSATVGFSTYSEDFVGGSMKTCIVRLTAALSFKRRIGLF